MTATSTAVSSTTRFTSVTPNVSPKAKVVRPLKTQFYGMREFAVTDPDGHLITFAERVAGD